MSIKTQTQAKINQTVIDLIEGDITRQALDAIVNAANSSLLGGGGVDGAIHRAAGPQLLAETRTLGGCETGDARISSGYKLPAKHVIHAVGPVYQRNNHKVPALLASAHRRSLEIAHEHGLKTIAFPAISTGIYGYPVEEAAPIALNTIIDFARTHHTLTLVRFVLFSEEVFQTYSAALAEAVAANDDLTFTASV